MLKNLAAQGFAALLLTLLLTLLLISGVRFWALRTEVLLARHREAQ